MHFEYQSIPTPTRKPAIAAIVLQSDETVESELRQWLPATEFDLHVSRIPSGETVTEETLGEMTNWITTSANLFPRSARYDAVAYCCTSGACVIGPDNVEEKVRSGCKTDAVTNPLTALINRCERDGLKKLAFLSPYVESVSERLRDALAEHGIETPVFGTFNEMEEAKVAWIDAASMEKAVIQLAEGADVDGVFLSCTNLKTFDILESLSDRLGKPVISSNSVLADHLRRLARQS